MLRPILLLIYISIGFARVNGGHQLEDVIPTLSIQPTGEVNVPATAAWNLSIGAFPGTYQVSLVQEEPRTVMSEIRLAVSPWQKEGIFDITATQTGTYHLEVPLMLYTVSSGRIVVTQSSQLPTPTATPPPTPGLSFSTPTVTIVINATASEATRGETSTTISSSSSYDTSTSMGFGGEHQPHVEKSSDVTQPSITRSSIIQTPVTTTAPTGPQSNTQFVKPSIIGAILGAIFGILALLVLILWLRYRQRKSRISSSGVFNREDMLSSPWWSSPWYNFGKQPHTEVSRPSESDDTSLAPSDSVSQLWKKGILPEKHRPLRPSTDLTIVSEKVEGN